MERARIRQRAEDHRPDAVRAALRPSRGAAGVRHLARRRRRHGDRGRGLEPARVRLERVARPPWLGSREQPVEELVADQAVDNQPRTGVADLPGVAEDTGGDLLGRCFEVGRVGEDDVRRLAAALEPDLLHVRLAGVAEEELAHLAGTGETYDVDVHVAPDGLSGGLAVTRNNVENARRNASLSRNDPEPDRRQRRLLRRFEHDRVACSERRPELPRGHEQRVVPRRHGSDDPRRLLRDQRERLRAGRPDLAEQLVERLRVVGDALRCEVHLAERVSDRLAHLERDQEGELVLRVRDPGGVVEQYPLPLPRREAAPDAALERLPGGADSGVDVRRVTCGDLRQRPSVDRAALLEGLPRAGRDELVGDQRVSREHQLLGARLPGGCIDGGGHGHPFRGEVGRGPVWILPDPGPPRHGLLRRARKRGERGRRGDGARLAVDDPLGGDAAQNRRRLEAGASPADHRDDPRLLRVRPDNGSAVGAERIEPGPEAAEPGARKRG